MISSYDFKEFGYAMKKMFSDLKEELNSRVEKLNGAFSSINEVSKPEERDSNKGSELIDAYSRKKEEIKYKQKPISIEKSEAEDKKAGLDIEFTEEKVLQAIVYSEILGKPKAKTRRR
ncbi:hypothetical protein [Clostridium aciditolerans]|uniref:Uncharacterized protein n=1 Tax=Clostridium aciditolerans TaxID=339861 RepID=A0A934HXH7_9CLOT|nr:hypothetical protein [Clostridium aciditolerans]MBI6872387.1 hypothetical protein [Clostridium aciditolerans]